MQMYKADTKNYTIENARHEAQFMDEQELQDYLKFVHSWKVTTKNKPMYEAWIQLEKEI